MSTFPAMAPLVPGLLTKTIRALRSEIATLTDAVAERDRVIEDLHEEVMANRARPVSSAQYQQALAALDALYTACVNRDDTARVCDPLTYHAIDAPQREAAMRTAEALLGLRPGLVVRR